MSKDRPGGKRYNLALNYFFKLINRKPEKMSAVNEETAQTEEPAPETTSVGTPTASGNASNGGYTANTQDSTSRPHHPFNPNRKPAAMMTVLKEDREDEWTRVLSPF